MCAPAHLVFRVVCTCSLFFNVSRLSENSTQRVLIVIDSILLLKWMQIRS